MDSWCLGKFFGKRERREEKISILLEPIVARQCTIAGWLHIVRLPHRERFRNALCHQKCTDPMRKKPQKGQAVSVLRSREPDVCSTRSEEVEYDLDKPRIAPYEHTWKVHHNTVYWCILKLAQREGLQFYQIRSHAVTLSSTLPAICIENVVYKQTWCHRLSQRTWVLLRKQSMKTVAGMPAIRESCLTETCEQNTHSYSTYSVAQCVSTSHWQYTAESHHFITRTCVSQVVFVCRKHSVIHASCLVPYRTWHWPPAQILSHLPLQSYSHPLQHTQACCPTIHIHTATIHSGVAVLRISNLPQVMSPKGSNSTGILRLNIKIKHETELWEMTIKVQSLKKWWIWKILSLRFSRKRCWLGTRRRTIT